MLIQLQNKKMNAYPDHGRTTRMLTQVLEEQTHMITQVLEEQHARLSRLRSKNMNTYQNHHHRSKL